MRKLFIAAAIVALTGLGSAAAQMAMSSYNSASNVLIVHNPKTAKPVGKIRFPSSYSAVQASKQVISSELTTEEIRELCSGWEGKDAQ